MSLSSPNLDDRDFHQLLEEARRRITQFCPEWTDLSPGDPGMMLLELFAHLTETLIYRLNRVPDKMYIEFLRLIGIRLHPATAASVMLIFSRARAEDIAIQIPRGTRVTLNRTSSASEALVFTTAMNATIPAGAAQVEVLAYQCEQIDGELVGTGTGLPGQTVRVQNAPIVAATGDDLDLVVGVETAPGELGERVRAIEYAQKSYRVWREVENFTNLGDDLHVYIADRISGILLFAPAARLEQENGLLETTPQALAAIPGAGREIRVWYRRGGGPEGNVEANTLIQLKDAITGIQVTNPGSAVGGRAAETLENALVRGPQQIHLLQRVVTARDFELVALYNSRAVARAKALTRAVLWTYAQPGTVEVLLVPFLQESDGQVTTAMLQKHQTEEIRTHVQKTLDERRPLGTMCVVSWARYKPVRVTARIVVRREEDLQAVRQRVIERLYQTINPLPTHFSATGWPFGEALRASRIYEVALAEPGVRWIDRVRLTVDEVPGQNVTSITADAFQPQTWYVGSGSTLFRSSNDGEGWEPAGRFTGEEVVNMGVHQDRPGLLAIVTRLPETGNARIYISQDCAETWQKTIYSLAFQVHDLAWTLRGGQPILLIATNVGLYELKMEAGASPIQVLVDQKNQALGFYSVVVGTDVRGGVNVAVAAQNNGGIYLSSTGGLTNSFRLSGLRGEDIRTLTIEQNGPRSFLWAGAAAASANDAGKGCFTWELRGVEDPPEGWQIFGKNWTGGTCRSIIFTGSNVLAASHRSGVLQLDTRTRDAAWQASDVGCGLPLRDPGRFYPVLTLATDPQARLVLAGGERGVFRSDSGGKIYISQSKKEFSDKVTLPKTWLFVSEKHEIEVVSEDEAD